MEVERINVNLFNTHMANQIQISTHGMIPNDAEIDMQWNNKAWLIPERSISRKPGTTQIMVDRGEELWKDEFWVFELHRLTSSWLVNSDAHVFVFVFIFFIFYIITPDCVFWTVVRENWFTVYGIPVNQFSRPTAQKTQSSVRKTLFWMRNMLIWNLRFTQKTPLKLVAKGNYQPK